MAQNCIVICLVPNKMDLECVLIYQITVRDVAVDGEGRLLQGNGLK